MKAWDDLDDSVRQRVLALAAGGQRHPDPEVAAAAYAWAVELARPLVVVLPRVVVLGAIDGLLGGAGASGAAPLRDWRIARLLRRLGPPASE